MWKYIRKHGIRKKNSGLIGVCIDMKHSQEVSKSDLQAVKIQLEQFLGMHVSCVTAQN